MANLKLDNVSFIGNSSAPASHLTALDAHGVGTSSDIHCGKLFDTIKQGIPLATKFMDVVFDGDSTWTDTYGIISQFASWLATQAPDHMVSYSSSNGYTYSRSTIISNGTIGRTKFTLGSNPRDYYTYDSARYGILSGGFTIDWECDLSNRYTPSAILLSLGSGTNIGFDLAYNAASWKLAWTTDGVTYGSWDTTLAHTISSSAIPAAALNQMDGNGVTKAPVFFRLVYVRDNGSSQSTFAWYYSLNGTTYTAMGTNAVAAGNEIYKSTGLWVLGARSGITGTTYTYAGSVYRVSVLDNSLAHPLTALPEFLGIWSNCQNFSGGPELRIWNGSIGGTAITDTTQTIAKQVAPHPSVSLVLYGKSHNSPDSTAYGDFLSAIATYRSYMTVAAPCAKLGVVTQVAYDIVRGRGKCAAHSVRCTAYRQNAVANGSPVLDFFRETAFLNNASTLTIADNVHPNAAGVAYQLAGFKSEWDRS